MQAAFALCLFVFSEATLEIIIIIIKKNDKERVLLIFFFHHDIQFITI